MLGFAVFQYELNPKVVASLPQPSPALICSHVSDCLWGSINWHETMDVLSFGWAAAVMCIANGCRTCCGHSLLQLVMVGNQTECKLQWLVHSCTSQLVDGVQSVAGPYCYRSSEVC